MSVSTSKIIHLLPLTRHGTSKLFSTTMCKSLPRAPSASSPKWKDFVNRKDPGEEGENVVSTNFGGVRLDSMNERTVNEEVMTVGNLTDVTEATQSSNSDPFHEQNQPIESKLYEPNNVKKEKMFNEHYVEQDLVTSIEKPLQKKNEVLPPKPPTVKAYKFINHLRNESILSKNSSKDPLRFSKETEVIKIGQGIETRIASVVPIGTQKNNSLSKDAELEGDNPGQNNLGGRVDPKFLPLDLTKLTSVEVIALLKDNIIYNKGDIVALQKPYGLAMFGAELQHSVEKYSQSLANFLGCETLHQVHRLDKITSGILLLAKTKECHLFLVEKFRQRQIKKYYWAIVNGTPQPQHGIINIPLGEAKINNRFRITLIPEVKSSRKKMRTSNPSLPAVTEFKTLKSRQNRSLLELQPLTGFKHQIRAHVGLGLGTPVLGDHKYSSISFEGQPQAVFGDILQRLEVRESRSRDLPALLHAKRVVIPHPEDPGRRDIVIEANLPFYFNRIMKRLQLAPPKGGTTKSWKEDLS